MTKSNYISLGIIVQNGITNYFYTIWAKKTTHISLCIIVHLCTIATVTMHICTVTVACAFVIILISVPTFFSLSSLCTANELSSPPHFLFPQMHTNKHTHTHAQTNPHGQTNREADRSSWVLRDAWSEHVGLDRWLIGARGSWPMLDRSLWVPIGAWLELVLIGAWGTIGARGSSAWTELHREGSCLIGAREIWPRGGVDLCWSELGSLTEKGLAWGRVDRS